MKKREYIARRSRTYGTSEISAFSSSASEQGSHEEAKAAFDWLRREDSKEEASEETFGSVGFESIFTHLEIISNGRPIKVINDSIDISKLKSLNEPKFSPEKTKIVHLQ